MTPVKFQRGETFVAGLKVREGDGSGLDCRIALKKAVNGRAPGDAAPVAGELDVVYVAHMDAEDDTSPAAFIGTLTAEETEDLEPGLYVMDARLTLTGGEIVQTETIQVEVRERVTGPVS